MVIGNVLYVMYLGGLLQTLLVRMAPCKRSFEVELARILIFCAGWVNPDNCVLVEALAVISVTVVLGVIGRGYIRHCLGRDVMAIRIYSQILDSLSVIGR